MIGTVHTALAFASLTLGAMVFFQQTGLAEEFLFRGLIAGSLSRRFSVAWANVIQALIFLTAALAYPQVYA